MKAIILGGDERMIYARRYLQEKGVIVKHDYSLENIKKEDNIILPFPCTKDKEKINNSEIKIKELIKKSKNKKIIGGYIPDDFKELNVIDFALDEEFVCKNAELTAEGTVFEIMKYSKKSIKDIDIAILGFGRIGKALAKFLYSFGSIPSIFARNETALTTAKEKGYKTYSLNKEIIFSKNNFDFIVNTVPARFLSENQIESISKKTIIFDVASKPFLIDSDYAKKNNLKYYRLSGLPSLYAPISAGEIIGEKIYNILINEELL